LRSKNSLLGLIKSDPPIANISGSFFPGKNIHSTSEFSLPFFNVFLTAAGRSASKGGKK